MSNDGFPYGEPTLRDEIEEKLEMVPKLPFLQGIELRKFMLRQVGLTDMFKNERWHRQTSS